MLELVWTKWLGSGVGSGTLTFRPDEPENSHVDTQVTQLLVTKYATDHAGRVWEYRDANEVLVEHAPCRWYFPHHPDGDINSNQANYCGCGWRHVGPHAFLVGWGFVFISVEAAETGCEEGYSKGR